MSKDGVGAGIAGIEPDRLAASSLRRSVPVLPVQGLGEASMGGREVRVDGDRLAVLCLGVRKVPLPSQRVAVGQVGQRLGT